MVLEQGTKQDGFVVHRVAVAHQRLGQFLEGEVGVGRDRVEVKTDLFHGDTP